MNTLCKNSSYDIIDKALIPGEKSSNELRLPRIMIKRNLENLTVLKNLKIETTSDENNLDDKAQCESAGNTELLKVEEDLGNLFQIENVRSLSEDERSAFEVLDEISIESKALKGVPFYFKNEDKLEAKLNVESSNKAKDLKTLTNLPEIVIGNGGAPFYLSDHKTERKCPLCFRALKAVKKFHYNIEMVSSLCDCGLVIFQDLSVENKKSTNKTLNYTKEPQNNIGPKLSHRNYSLEFNDFKTHHNTCSVENINTNDKLIDYIKKPLNKIDDKDANCASESKDKKVNVSLAFKAHEYTDKSYYRQNTSKLKVSKEMEVKGTNNKTDYVANIKLEETKISEPKILKISCSPEEAIPECCTSFYVVQDKNENRNSSLTMHMKIKDIVHLAVNKNKTNNKNNRKNSKDDSLQCISVTKNKQIVVRKLMKTSNKNFKNISKSLTISKRKHSEKSSSLNDVTKRINHQISVGEKQKFVRKKYTKMKNNEKNMTQKSKAIKRNHKPVVKKEAIESELNKNVIDINNNGSSEKNKEKKALSISAKKKNLKQPKSELQKLDIKKKNKSALKCAALNIPRMKIEKIDEKVNMSLNCKTTKNNQKRLNSKDVKIENSNILKKKKDAKKEIGRKMIKGKDVKIENSSILKKRNEKVANKEEIRSSSRQRMKPYSFPSYDGRGRFIHQDIWGSMSARELEVSQIKLEKLE